jgi:predicted heme/steroid binding protein
MTTYQGKLYVVSNNKLWQRGNLGPGTGNDWSDRGDGYGITAMTTYQGKLYVVSNNKLWRRGNLGPGTGNDWSDCGTFTVPASTAQPKPLYAVSRP